MANILNLLSNEELIRLVRQMIDEKFKLLKERIESLESKNDPKKIIEKMKSLNKNQIELTSNEQIENYIQSSVNAISQCAREAGKALQSISEKIYSDADGKSPRQLGDILDELTTHWKSLGKK